jgi:hypothetical protein
VEEGGRKVKVKDKLMIETEKRQTGRGREREDTKSSLLLTLKVEEGAMSKGMEAISRRCKR